jgi:tRNA A-37 threonylcarbamoyl transferase component Bud32
MCWIDEDVVAALNADGGPVVTGSILEALISAGRVKSVLKHDERSRVELVDAGGRQWVCKRLFMGALLGRLYHRLRCSPAWREWKGARRLRVLGRRVNSPAVLVHDGRKGGRAQMLVLPYVEGRTLDAWIGDAPPAAQRPPRVQRAHHELAATVGRQIGRLVAAGVVNRDHKPTNLVIDDACLAGEAEPVIIDPAGVRRRRNDEQVFRMLAVLMRSAQRVGQITPREALRCLRAVLANDPSLGKGRERRLKHAARRVQELLDSRPLSYDPVTKRKIE